MREFGSNADINQTVVPVEETRFEIATQTNGHACCYKSDSAQKN